jgi:hypothetical protein
MINMTYSPMDLAFNSLENLQYDDSKKQLNLALEQISQLPTDQDSTERIQEIEQLSDEVSSENFCRFE